MISVADQTPILTSWFDLFLFLLLDITSTGQDYIRTNKETPVRASTAAQLPSSSYVRLPWQPEMIQVTQLASWQRVFPRGGRKKDHRPSLNIDFLWIKPDTRRLNNNKSHSAIITDGDYILTACSINMIINIHEMLHTEKYFHHSPRMKVTRHMIFN